MKRIKSPMRPAILFLAFACALTSFAKEYTFRIIHNSWLETTYQVVFDSSSHNLKFQESSFSKWKDIFTVTNVKATFVEDTFFEDNFKYWSGADHKTGGILFTKDGNNIFLVFYEMIYYDYSEDEIRSEDFVFWENGKWQRRHNPVDKPLSDLQGDELEFYKTFNALKKDLTSGAINSSVKTTATSTKTSSTSTPTKTPATTTAKKEDNTPYTATVTNPRYYLRKPGQNLGYEWLIKYDVINSRQMDRWNYLYVQNADTKQWLKSSKTGKDSFGSSANGTNDLTFELTADELPHATEGNPVRLKMWIYMSTPSVKGWIGKFETPVFIWDGKYMRQE